MEKNDAYYASRALLKSRERDCAVILLLAASMLAVCYYTLGSGAPFSDRPVHVPCEAAPSQQQPADVVSSMGPLEYEPWKLSAPRGY